MESRLTLESFLQGSTGEVTVLAGQAGSGKTLLMSHLGQQWAHGLVNLLLFSFFNGHKCINIYITVFIFIWADQSFLID